MRSLLLKLALFMAFLSATSARAVDTVVVTGPQFDCQEVMVDWMGGGGGYMVWQCFDFGTGTWGDPYSGGTPVTNTGGTGGALPAETARSKIAKEMYKVWGKVCMKPGEHQEDWLIRVTGECAKQLGQGVNCHIMRTVLGEAAAQNKLDPPPPSCPPI
jgi:hypothetical protein